MDDKVKKAAEKVIAEHSSLPEEVQGAVASLAERHSYVAHLEAHHAVRNILGSITSCSKTDLLVFSGTDMTGSGGHVTIPIQSLLCGAETENLEPGSTFVIVSEPRFVATALGSTPVFLTASSRSTAQAPPAAHYLGDRDGNMIWDRNYLGDVSVKVMAWRHDGSAGAMARFSWLCTVEVMKLAFIGG